MAPPTVTGYIFGSESARLCNIYINIGDFKYNNISLTININIIIHIIDDKYKYKNISSTININKIIHII